MSVQLLVEELRPIECNLISESSPDGKNVWLAGIFMQADIKNRNGRRYPLHEISGAIREAETRIKEQKGIMGELDHPQTLTINLDRVSHVITELKLDGTNGVGRAKLLGTPMGNIAKELIIGGVVPGVSTRGAGSVDPNGDVSGFQFVTVDIVAQPSAPNAYPATVYESLQIARNGHNIMELAEAVRHDPSAQKYLKAEILKWLQTGLFKKR
jgi:hypothetical protein